jgi:hypothetical protein
MKKIKDSKFKYVVVKCADMWEDTIKIDSEIFDDIYMEAATRCIEKRKDDEDLKLAIILECWEKKETNNPNKHFCYNTYYVMNNAGLYTKAELLRHNFKLISNIDLKKESMRGEDNNNGQPS